MKKETARALITLTLWVMVTSVSADTLSGRVVKIADGDTLTILIGEKTGEDPTIGHRYARAKTALWYESKAGIG